MRTTVKDGGGYNQTNKETLFQATPTPDKANKFNSTYQIGTRAEGVVITAVGTGSGAVSAAGLSTCATGIGCALAGAGLAYSSDIMSTGLRQAYSGKTENTLGAQALNEVLGIPLSTAEMVYSAAGVAGEISAIRSGLKLAASTNKVTIPVNATNKIPSWSGSGPQAGIIGLNSSSKSNGALLNYYPKNVEYIFDPTTSTFLVGGRKSPAMHEYLANSINADRSKVVGGHVYRGNDGVFLMNERSGHFWQNWTPEIRKQFVKTMQGYGIKVKMDGF